MNTIAIYPGTFDPLTEGHVDLICRAAKLFDQIIVAIASNQSKQPLFNLEERVALATASLNHLSKVKVLGFSQLLADFAQQQGASVLIRGVRSMSDFDYEKQMAQMNSKLLPGLETVILIPDERFACISSTIVKEVARHGGEVQPFVPAVVHLAIKHKLQGS
jgi:pantetheine-phosphate adenylyltransferase